MPELRDGTYVEDRRLDELYAWDVRNEQYLVREVLPTDVPRSYTWSVPMWLDQGREGACVGFSVTHEYAARPARHFDVDDEVARALYRRAQFLDEWPDDVPYEGTSVLAGMKAAVEKGWFGEYRWATDEDDLFVAVGRTGPAVVGVNWYEGMFDTDGRGWIHPTGRVMGRHAVLVNSVRTKSKRNAEESYRIWNSWGQGWGDKGRARLSRDTMARLFDERGVAVIPVDRA